MTAPYTPSATTSPGLLSPGNIDLNNRPVVKNKDGTISTVRSMSFEENGKEILVPTVSDSGTIMSDQQAIDQYHQSGKHLGIFGSVQAADSAAQAIHNQQDKRYSQPSRTAPYLPSATTQPSFTERLFSKQMSNDEIELHKRNAMKMASEGKSLAEIKSYMDGAGVPQKQKVDYSPGLTPDYILGGVMSALHGATFGWDDEGVGSLYGLVTGSGAQAGRDVYRKRLQDFHDQNPMTDVGLQIAGAIGTGKLPLGVAKLVAPKAAEWMMALPGAVKAIGAAGLGGGAYAAGDATGGLSARAAAIPAGAATGAVVGGALTGGSVAAGRTLSPVLRKMPLVKGLFATAGEEADHTLLMDLERDKVRIPDMIDKAKGMVMQGQTPTIGDLAGENVLGRYANIQSIPGAGKESVRAGLVDRQAGSGDRIMEMMSGKAKLSLENVEKVRDGLLGARSLQAETLYNDAYQQSAPMTDRLKEVFQNPLWRRAYNEARIELKQTKGMDVPMMPAKPFVPGQAEELPTALPIAGLDWTKRYLDKLVRAGYRSDTGWDRGKAQGLADQLKGALTEIDDLVPAYGLARKTYRGDSEVINALDEGRTFAKLPADKIALKMQGYRSTSEGEAAKLGFLENIRNMIYGKTAEAPDVATTVLGSKEMRRRVEAMFGTDAPEMLNYVRTEARFAKTLRGAAGGSRTAPLDHIIKDWTQQNAGVVGNLVAGRPGSALVALARGAGARVKATHTENVADELAHRFTLGLDDPTELLGYLMNLQSLQPKPSFAPRVAAALGGQSVAGQGY
jgi:hypothetical protein